MGELRIRGSDADVTGQGEVEASAEAVATNCGDDGFWRALNAGHHTLAKEGEFASGERRQFNEFVNIRASGEGFVGACDDDTRNGGV